MKAAAPTGEREAIIDASFLEAASSLEARPAGDPEAPVRAGSRLLGRQALALFEAQLWSRHLDLAARWMRARGTGFYTIGSSGHEGNAAVAEAVRPDDPALLHYRSGAFFLRRAAQVGYPHAARDVLLGVAASREEPIAGGRHKVLGSAELWIPPQTSTIASHLPRAMGLAFGLELAKRLVVLGEGLAPDAIVVCSFGDASVNHSTALGALNTSACLAYQHLAVPVLFVCEDNGLGISVPTPAGWIAALGRAWPGLRYLAGDGCDLAAAYDVAAEAAEHVRARRAPAFLHLRTVRLLGHAGSDVELAYRTLQQVRESEAGDPLLASAALICQAGLLSPDEILHRYEAIRAEARALAEECGAAPRLRDAADVMRPLAPRSPERVRREVTRVAEPAERARLAFFEDRLPEREEPGTLAQLLNRALLDLLARYPELVVFGEDVARKGGVYGVTKHLLRKAGAARVFDTLLDEQSILGFGLGAAQAGLLPLAEIQYLAYLHNAEDQLRGEAATLQFFSQGRFKNPLVVRIAGYAYQKGFGGHFHNDNSVAVLRDIPGLVIASPARGDDAAAMLHTCAAAARVDGAVCAFLEPIALYNTRDLHEPGDGGWLSRYPATEAHVPLGAARLYGEGGDVLLVSFANGVPMSLRAARRLEGEGIRCRVLDLRWLAPLPLEDLVREASSAERVLVVDETRRSGGVSEGIVTALVDAGLGARVRRVASRDSFVPLGPAAEHVLLGERDIEDAVRGWR